jgi:N-acetylmuramoyl-L-alanine amidase
MPIYCGDGIIADLPFYGHSLTVLKHTISPAALVEFGFISNLADRALLADDDILARAAQGIATGILAWVFAGSGGGGA